MRTAVGIARAGGVVGRVGVPQDEEIPNALPTWRNCSQMCSRAGPPIVHRLIRRCLQKDPRRRIHVIADARVEIEEALEAPGGPDTSDVCVRPHSTPSPGRKTRSNPFWSPDGQWLAFVAGGKQCEPTDWSPDGRMLILTVRTAQGADVWTIPVGPRGLAGAARPLFAERFNERDARVSPDAEWIAYVSDESGREEISVRRVSGGERTVISSGGGHQPVWRRDGAELFNVDPQGALRAVAMGRGSDGRWVPGVPVQLGVPPIGVGHWGTQYDVTRDGSRVYFLDRPEPELATRIEVVLGWASLLR